MSVLQTPQPGHGKVRSLVDFLHISSAWQQKQNDKAVDTGFLGQLWYRGVDNHRSAQAPGVYRDRFTTRAAAIKNGSRSLEEKRLFLEREMISQFRIAGAAYFDPAKFVDVYVVAQHFGMPTRLLDWSTNPLAALFFACGGGPDSDGAVYAMDARKIIPPKAKRTSTERLYQAVMTLRHPFVEYAVGLSFWLPVKENHYPHILPVRPDIIPGRIGQQNSCFTLHMHGAPEATNDTLITIAIDGTRKSDLLGELHALNVNQFTIYNDLDHLSKEVKLRWGIEE
jgi:hypothetical protein